MNSIEDYRRVVLRDLLASETMRNGMAIWRPELERLTKKFSDAGRVLDLGDSLSQIFVLTSAVGRGQGVLSAAGTAWEGLVTLYLNLVFSGTNAVAMKQKKSLVPQCIFDATSINYHNDSTNTESDVVVLIFPSQMQFNRLCCTNRLKAEVPLSPDGLIPQLP